jgi:glutamate---cysteine ligase / carboxylate-amine ligase
MQSAPYTVGIEDRVLRDRSPDTKSAASRAAEVFSLMPAPRQVASEMLQCQIEAMTRPCGTMMEAREQSRFLRRIVAGEAARYGLGTLQ